MSTQGESPAATIVIPAYNEERSIGQVVAHIQTVMDATDMRYQVLVVDDGSTDRTPDIACEQCADVLRRPTNKGYGAALKTGIRRAQYNTIVITDADGTYPNDQIPNLIKLMEGCDMVVGARTGENVHIPTIRRPAKWFINSLADYLTRTNIPDLNSGLRVFRKDVVLRFYPILPDGFSFTTTITMAMLANGYTVEYVPISYHPRIGESKIRPIHDTLYFILLIIRTTVYYAPLRVFLPLGAIVFLLGTIIGLYSFFVLGRVMDVTTVVLILAALQIFATGLLADMIDKRTPRF